jgi:serine-type D-Ala-D-Ala carboxypeptidase (penicillin-binding protein 5/6)
MLSISSISYRNYIKKPIASHPPIYLILMKKLPIIQRSATAYKRKFKDSKLPIKLSSKNWVVLCSGRYYFGKLATERRKAASLTKIMTAYTVIKYAEDHAINLLSQKVVISLNASSLGGTTAGLQKDDELTVWDLLHGMMLPSGNDAAFALAEHFGKLMYTDKFGIRSKYGLCLERFFISEMNKNAHALHMFSTYYTNPHGLDNEFHKSCAYDIGLLAYKAMKNKQFQRIVNCKYYEMDIADSHKLNSRHVLWENTNLLLSTEGYNGVKTGITPEAGPCLCISYHKGKMHLIIVLLNCDTMEMRWKETRNIVKYCTKCLKHSVTKLKLPHISWSN